MDDDGDNFLAIMMFLLLLGMIVYVCMFPGSVAVDWCDEGMMIEYP